MKTITNPLARQIADDFCKLSSVEAVTVGGANVIQPWGSRADIELFVYSRDAFVDPAAREQLITARADHFEIGQVDEEMADQWLEQSDDTHVRVVYRGVGWVIDEVQQIMTYRNVQTHSRSQFLYNIRHTQLVFDRGNWFSELLKTANQSYPLALAESIIATRYPMLRTNFSSYTHQIERYLAMGDKLAVQTTLATLIAGAFDVLFAANHVPNPGPPHLIEAAEATCVNCPAHLRENVHALLSASPDELIPRIHRFLNGLDEILEDMTDVAQ